MICHFGAIQGYREKRFITQIEKTESFEKIHRCLKEGEGKRNIR